MEDLQQPNESAGPASTDQLPLLHGGAGIITGTVVCAAVIAASADKVDSSAQLSAAILGTIFVYWLAHLHADTLGSAIRHQHHPIAALRHAVVDTWTIAAASLLPLAVLLAAELVGLDLRQAAWTALLATIALLATYSFVAGRRGGLGLAGSLSCMVAGAALGVVVAALKAALH